MKSALPKVLHPLLGRTLLGHVLAAAAPLGADRTLVVVGHGADAVTAHLAEVAPAAAAGAAGRAARHRARRPDRAGRRRRRRRHRRGPQRRRAAAARRDAGRAGRGARGGRRRGHRAHRRGGRPDRARPHRPRRAAAALERIVEQRDATDAQRAIREINAGIYAFDAAALREALGKLSTDNDQGEEYLTDVFGAARRRRASRWACTVAPRRRRDAGLQRPGGAGGAAGAAARPGQPRLDARRRHDPRPGDDLDRRHRDAGAGRGDRPEHPAARRDHGRRRRRRRAGHHAVDTVVGGGRHGAAGARRRRARSAREATVGPYSYLRPGTVLGREAQGRRIRRDQERRARRGAKVPAPVVRRATPRSARKANIGAAHDLRELRRRRTSTTPRSATPRSWAATRCWSRRSRSATAPTWRPAARSRQDVPPGALGVTRAPQRNVDGWVARKRPGTVSDAAARAAAAEA